MAKIELTFIVTILIGLIATQHDADFVKKNHEFAFKIFNGLYNTSTEKNFVFSPYLIQNMGALLYSGANGDTAEEIFEKFNLPSKDSKENAEKFKFLTLSKNMHNENSHYFNFHTKLYVSKNYTLAPTYKDLAQNKYFADIESTDFTQENVLESMNAWMKSNEIEQKLKETEAPAHETEIFLLNSINAKSNWRYKMKSIIEPRPLWQDGSNHVLMDFLQTAVRVPVKFTRYEATIQALEIDLQYLDLSVVFITPDQFYTIRRSRNFNYTDLLLNKIFFTKDIFNDMKPENARIYMPKFTIKYTVPFSEIMKNVLGISKTFSHDADFKNIVDDKISLTKAYQTVGWETDGTGGPLPEQEPPKEYKYVTDIPNSARSDDSDEKENFYIDTSFLYFVKGKDGMIYLMGRYLE